MNATELVAKNGCPKEIRSMLDYRYSMGWQLQLIIPTESNFHIYLFKQFL